MNTYHVEFYFYTDLRCDATVIAPNYITALTLGLLDVGEEDWMKAAGSRIEVSIVNMDKA